MSPAQAGEKIDALLRRELHLSGTAVRRAKWVEDGILLDGARAITGQRVNAGQTLSVLVSDPHPRLDMVPTPGPLDIAYEAGAILVVADQVWYRKKKLKEALSTSEPLDNA